MGVEWGSEGCDVGPDLGQMRLEHNTRQSEAVEGCSLTLEVMEEEPGARTQRVP